MEHLCIVCGTVSETSWSNNDDNIAEQRRKHVLQNKTKIGCPYWWVTHAKQFGWEHRLERLNKTTQFQGKTDVCYDCDEEIYIQDKIIYLECDEICSVCQTNNVEVETTQCKHRFCKTCISEWLNVRRRHSPSCPCCREGLWDRRFNMVVKV